MVLIKTLTLVIIFLSNGWAYAQCNWWLDKSETQAVFSDLRLEQLLPRDQTSYYAVTDVTPLKMLVTSESRYSLSATPEVINETFKDLKVPRKQVRAALDFLLHLELRTQINLAVNFEAFAVEIMKRSQNDWQAFRYFGKDGSIAYAGLAGHGLAITPNGDIYLGIIDRAQLRNDAQWLPKYSRLKKITLENTP